MEPPGRPVAPYPGCSCTYGRAWPTTATPYTVFGHEPDSRLSITVQEDGPQSFRMQELAAGQELLVDGPFGVFTRLSRATDWPLVMVAVRIGITPFRRLWQTLEQELADEGIQGEQIAHELFAFCFRWRPASEVGLCDVTRADGQLRVARPTYLSESARANDVVTGRLLRSGD